MQIDLAAAAWTATLVLCAMTAAALAVLAIRHRRKWLPPLEELVTLDSRGWFLVASIASAGAAIMVLTSQLFSSAYWVGLAIDSDGKEIPEKLFLFGWLKLVSITTIAAFALSVMFELVADIGAPAASGLKKEKRKGTPELLLVATAFAIVMSLASKWGYYEDKRQARAIEAAQTAAALSAAADTLEEAQATIDRLAATPSLQTINATAASLAAQSADAKKARDDAIAARDGLPPDHSTNRLRFQEVIDRQTERLADLERQTIANEAARDDLGKLTKARADKADAQKILEADAGKLTSDKKEIVKIGDTILIRLIRSGLHQALCFLFPIIALDAWTAHRAVAKREEAARKAADTRRRNNPNSVFDAEFGAAEPPDFTPPPPRYLPRAEGEAPSAADDVTDADFEGDDGDTDTGEAGDTEGETDDDDRRDDL